MPVGKSLKQRVHAYWIRESSQIRFWKMAPHQYTKDTLVAPRFQKIISVSKTTNPSNTPADSFRFWGSVEYKYIDLVGLIMNIDSKPIGTTM